MALDPFGWFPPPLGKSLDPLSLDGSLHLVFAQPEIISLSASSETGFLAYSNLPQIDVVINYMDSTEYVAAAAGEASRTGQVPG